MITLDSTRHSVSFVIDELDYTLARLTARPFGKTYVPAFTSLLALADKAAVTETEQRRTVLRAKAGLDEADDAIDALVRKADAFVTAVPGEPGERLRGALFRGIRPSTVTRPRLGDELTHVRAWPMLLKTAPTTPLQELAPAFTAAIQAADTAQAAYTRALDEIAHWKATGRAALFDKANAERRGLEGEARKQASTNPSDTDPSLLLFRTGDRPEREPTLTALRAEITAAEAELEDLRRRLREAEAALAQEEADAQTLGALEKAAAEAEAAAAAAAKRAEELRTRIRSPRK